jgi:hypothetical protein
MLILRMKFILGGENVKPVKKIKLNYVIAVHIIIKQIDPVPTREKHEGTGQC